MKLFVSAAIAALLVATPTLCVAAKSQAKTPAVARPILPDPDIPYTRYVLKNGLTLLVHEDHKAPIVAVNIWYHVGAKDEPRGRSGFAHLFEHLMFNGSENHNDDFFKVTERIGATDMNGTTNNDRTNYFQNVPKSALDTILWLESDRMGHLLGALDQPRLDEQRGVVQNEKRQGENRPYGQAWNLITKATYPEEHPYGHTVIGSMDDLNAAKLDDVKDWFRTYYGPSNATIVLAGDITPAEAKAKVEAYFGDIQPGPPVAHPKVWIAKRSGAQREIAYDHVAQPRLYKVWNIPQDGDPDARLLDLASDVLVSDKASRLYKRLVFDEQIATDVSAYAWTREIAGQFVIEVTAKQGQDLARIEREVDEELAKLFAAGPTTAELDRMRTRRASSLLQGLERIGGFGGKSDLLAQSQTFHDAPDAWKADLAALKTATPRQIQDAAQRWLSDGSYTLSILPVPDFAASGPGADRKTMPAPARTASPVFPTAKRLTLSNGLKVVVVERHVAPTVQLGLMVNTGYAPDYLSQKTGTGSLAVALMDDGTATRDAIGISEELSGLGASLSTQGGGEASYVNMSTLTATLGPSLALFADVVENPAFRPADVERERALAIAGVQQQKRNPSSMAFRAAGPAIYGRDHPYGRITTEESLTSLRREDLAAFHARWFHPNNATLVVVGDVEVAQLTPRLEAAFAGWKPAAVPPIAVPPAPAGDRPVVYLVDKPDAQQSMILVGNVAPPRSDQDEIAIDTFNTVLGGAFVSRLNMNLREDKHWSYGASSFVGGGRGPWQFTAYASVQTDKTAESAAELRKELTGVINSRPVTAEELAMAQNNMTLSLPGAWETNGAVGGYLTDMAYRGRADDYYDGYADKVRAVTIAETSMAARKVVRDGALVWVIVGDRKKIEPGVAALNLGEIRHVDADGNLVP